VSRPEAILGALGLIVSTVYALWLVQRVFHGPRVVSGQSVARAGGRRPRGLSVREIVMFAIVIFVLLWLGLYPQTLVRTMKPTTDFLLGRPQGLSLQHPASEESQEAAAPVIGETRP
jgi:NADH-quinone oxidoreductase subunit M